MDSFNPDGEIVERKNTQLAEVHPSTWKSYLTKTEDQYEPGNDEILVADTKTNREDLTAAGYEPDDFIGKPLEGQLVLEVPVQNAPPPVEMLELAKLKSTEVKDVAGTQWLVSEDGRTITELRADGSYNDYTRDGTKK